MYTLFIFFRHRLWATVPNSLGWWLWLLPYWGYLVASFRSPGGLLNAPKHLWCQFYPVNEWMCGSKNESVQPVLRSPLWVRCKWPETKFGFRLAPLLCMLHVIWLVDSEETWAALERSAPVLAFLAGPRRNLMVLKCPLVTIHMPRWEVISAS